MKDPRRSPNLSLWGLAGLLAAASVVLPPLLNLNDHLGSAVLTAEAYAMMAGLMVGGLVLGTLDPGRSAHWGVVVGLAPLAVMILRMADEGPGNLWPVAIVLSLILGWPPASLGAFIGKALRCWVTSIRRD